MSTARTIRRFTDAARSTTPTLARCLEAATWAPSGANAQAWRFVVLRSPRAAGGRRRGRGPGADGDRGGVRHDAARRRRRQPTAQRQPGHLRIARQGRRIHLGAVRSEASPDGLRACCWRARSSRRCRTSCSPPARRASAHVSPAGRPTAARQLLRRPLACPRTGCSPATSSSGWPKGRHGPVRRRPWQDAVNLDHWDEPAPDIASSSLRD